MGENLKEKKIDMFFIPNQTCFSLFVGENMKEKKIDMFFIPVIFSTEIHVTALYLTASSTGVNKF